ncbi:MAG TPA: bifunctional 2-polyprenyl-6-hydroxyphenol methylase/3-demethylubiquinol 3-O-methyltransferase UbiG [Alphaproteobacteria bacterium]|nr:bifunctional 2-polyprenyl-6-hydroxyphenol methylase/3-demethylubiquinol 3-O-methyltransferase UbiG [Alphaproteobacteria bacterium]
MASTRPQFPQLEDLMVKTAADTVDRADIDRFERVAAEWWDPSGPFKPLHRMNPLRVGFIRDRVAAHFGRDPLGRKPLDGLRLVDVGCGGGLLTEPMARLGADASGIDAGAEAVEVARSHAEAAGLAIDYRRLTVEELAASGARFDVVLALEIVEHVADVPTFLEALSAILEPGGAIVMSTLSRTPKSFALAVVGAEYLLRWVPRGTHNWRQFLRPSELAAGLRDGGVDVTTVQGMVLDPLRGVWSLSDRDLDVNYILFGRKPA